MKNSYCIQESIESNYDLNRLANAIVTNITNILYKNKEFIKDLIESEKNAFKFNISSIKYAPKYIKKDFLNSFLDKNIRIYKRVSGNTLASYYINSKFIIIYLSEKELVDLYKTKNSSDFLKILKNNNGLLINLVHELQHAYDDFVSSGKFSNMKNKLKSSDERILYTNDPAEIAAQSQEASLIISQYKNKIIPNEQILNNRILVLQKYIMGNRPYIKDKKNSLYKKFYKDLFTLVDEDKLRLGLALLHEYMERLIKSNFNLKIDVRFSEKETEQLIRNAIKAILNKKINNKTFEEYFVSTESPKFYTVYTRTFDENVLTDYLNEKIIKEMSRIGIFNKEFYESFQFYYV